MMQRSIRVTRLLAGEVSSFGSNSLSTEASEFELAEIALHCDGGRF